MYHSIVLFDAPQYQYASTLGLSDVLYPHQHGQLQKPSYQGVKGVLQGEGREIGIFIMSVNCTWASEQLHEIRTAAG